MGTALSMLVVFCSLITALACSEQADPGPGPGADGAAAADGTTPLDSGASNKDSGSSKQDAKAPRDKGKPQPDAKQQPQPDSAPPAKVTAFKQYVVDSNPDKPAFVVAADLDKDGKKELIVSVFAGSSPIGSGLLAVYTSQKGNPGAWSKKVIVPKTANVKFPNAVSVADVDGDGDRDLILPYGFLACVPLSCGGLAWLEQTPAGWKRHDIVKNGSPLFYHHVELVDMDGDKLRDMVTVGESKGLFGGGKAVTQIFAGTKTADRFAATPKVVGNGGGSLPTVLDVDGDGDLDIASAQYFVSDGAAAWFERSKTGWKKHIIDTGAGPSIQLSFVPGLLGKGKVTPVLANHTNQADTPTAPESAVYMLQAPKDPRGKWSRTKISTGIKSRKSPLFGPQGAPGVFHWGDLDGDKDLDLLVSGDGDPRIFWLEQRPGGTFITHVLAKDLPQAGVAAADLDGDGVAEAVVSSYEKNRRLVFKSYKK